MEFRLHVNVWKRRGWLLDLPVVELGREEQRLAVAGQVLHFAERRHMAFHSSVTLILEAGNVERSA